MRGQHRRLNARIRDTCTGCLARVVLFSLPKSPTRLQWRNVIRFLRHIMGPQLITGHRRCASDPSSHTTLRDNTVSFLSDPVGEVFVFSDARNFPSAHFQCWLGSILCLCQLEKLPRYCGPVSFFISCANLTRASEGAIGAYAGIKEQTR